MWFYIWLNLISLIIAGAYGGRIISGSDAEPDDKFTIRVLSVEDNVTLLAHVTTGVAISPNFGIVTAQAIYGFRFWYIGFGSIHTNEHEIQRINSNNIRVHPEYDAETLIHNIAVIKFTKAVANYLPPAIERPALTILQIFGFGYRSQSSTEPTITLQQLHILMLAVCLPIYPNFDKDNSFCGLFPLQSLITAGDQGGPVTDANRNEVYGIVSYWGTDDSDPVVIIDFASYKTFIDQTIELINHNCCK